MQIMEYAKWNMMLYSTHYKQVNKKEKDVGLEDIHIITTFVFSQKRVWMNKLANLIN